MQGLEGLLVSALLTVSWGSPRQGTELSSILVTHAGVSLSLSFLSVSPPPPLFPFPSLPPSLIIYLFQSPPLSVIPHGLYLHCEFFRIARLLTC